VAIKYRTSGNATTLPPDALPHAGERAVEESLSAWAGGTDGLFLRFGVAAFSRYGYTPRTLSYQKQQRSKLGFVAPFTSPVKNRPNKFRDLIRVPTLGHRVSVGQVGGRTVGYLTARAARGLNPHPRYLYEWSTLHPIEARELLDRIETRLAQRTEEALNG
jgi:hypothetical protein